MRERGPGLTPPGGCARHSLFSFALATVLVLGMVTGVSCSSDDEAESADRSSSPSTTTSSPTTADESSPTTAGDARSPEPGSKECTDVDERADGRYDVGAAGAVVLRHDRSRLELVDVEEPDGWRVRVDDDEDDPDEVELDLRSDDDTKVEFEAEIEDDGVLEIELCMVG